MKLGRCGWGLKRLSLARFQRNRAMGFGEREKKGRRGVVFLWREPRTTSATFLRLISAKFPTNTYPDGGSWHMVSYSRKVSINGSNLPETSLFYGTLLVISLRVTENVLRRLHSFHPLVDISQMCLSWVTFAEGCTVFQLSTSESVLISNGDT